MFPPNQGLKNKGEKKSLGVELEQEKVWILLKQERFEHAFCLS